MQEQATCTCSECGQPVPESYEPVAVTIPGRAYAVSASGDVPHVWGRARVFVFDRADPMCGYWIGPTLAISWDDEPQNYVEVALVPEPEPGECSSRLAQPGHGHDRAAGGHHEGGSRR